MNYSSNNPFIVYPTQLSQSNCDSCNDPACGAYTNAKCVYYSGPALPCTGIGVNDNLELALQKIEAKVCEATGDYSTYDTSCLAPITTQQEFVEAISSGYCTLLANYNTFIGTTFPAYQASITSQLNAITNPRITCAIAGVNSGDSLVSVLNKYCAAMVELNTAMDVSGADWDTCYTVIPTPSTLTEAFNVLIGQICTLKGSISSGALGTFDNTCIGGGSSEDAATSIQGLLDYMCSVPVFNPTTLTFGCVTAPVTLNLQNIIQTMLTKLDDYVKNKLTFSGDFSVTQTDPMNACSGKSVALTTPLNSDRLVASNVADVTPGTLIEKLDAGAGITLDDITTPGKVIISAVGSTDSYKVKAASDGSDTEGYLINKVKGKTDIPSGLSLGESYNPTTQKVDLVPSIDWNTFITKWFAELNSNSALALLFCSQVQGCVDSSLACFTFAVSLDTVSASTGTVSYIDCSGNPQVLTLNLSTPSATICAQRIVGLDSYITIANMGACTTGTTTTSSTSTTTTTTTTAAPADKFVAQNTTANNYINSVTPGFFVIDTGTFPVGPGSIASGTHISYSSIISVEVNAALAGSLKLYINRVLQECIAVSPGITTYNFAVTSFSVRDKVLILHEDAACVGP